MASLREIPRQPLTLDGKCPCTAMRLPQGTAMGHHLCPPRIRVVGRSQFEVGASRIPICVRRLHARRSRHPLCPVWTPVAHQYADPPEDWHWSTLAADPGKPFPDPSSVSQPMFDLSLVWKSERPMRRPPNPGCPRDLVAHSLPSLVVQSVDYDGRQIPGQLGQPSTASPMLPWSSTRGTHREPRATTWIEARVGDERNAERLEAPVYDSIAAFGIAVHQFAAH
jgi:hypothetical protein